MKKYKFDQLAVVVKNIDGTDAKMVNATQTDIESFTVKKAFMHALNGVFPDEQAAQGSTGLSFEQKMKRYELAKRIWNIETKDELTLSTEEQADLKICVGKAFKSPEVYGFLVDILEAK